MADHNYSFDHCDWYYTDHPEYAWTTMCGNMHMFTAGGIEDNNYSFCPFCGKEIVEIDPFPLTLVDDDDQ